MFGETEICHFDVAVRSEQQVLRLQVSIDDVEGMEVIQGECDFCSVELGDRVGEALRWISLAHEGHRRSETSGTNLRLSQQTEQLSSSDKVHDHIQIVHILERSPQVDQEWVSDPDQHLSLRVGVLDLLHLDDFLLVQDLHGVEPTVVLGADEVDSAERTCT